MSIKRKFQFVVTDLKTNKVRYTKIEELFNYEFLKIDKIIQTLETKFANSLIVIKVL